MKYLLNWLSLCTLCTIVYYHSYKILGVYFLFLLTDNIRLNIKYLMRRQKLFVRAVIMPSFYLFLNYIFVVFLSDVNFNGFILSENYKFYLFMFPIFYLPFSVIGVMFTTEKLGYVKGRFQYHCPTYWLPLNIAKLFMYAPELVNIKEPGVPVVEELNVRRQTWCN